MTVTATSAYETMVAHHRMLGTGLTDRAAAVSEAVAAGRPHGTAVAGLIAYLAEDVLPHAAAEEETIYPAAAAHADLAGLVDEMRAEHGALSSGASGLAGLTDGTAVAALARQITDLFMAHVTKENEAILPALLADHSADLAGLLDAMHAGARPAARETARPPVQGSRVREDPQAALVSLLLQSTGALARAGEADRACRIAASAWAAVRGPRPDLAVMVTAALHGLARRTSEKGEAGPGAGGPGAGRPGIGVQVVGGQGRGARSDGRDVVVAAAAAVDRELDVRDLAPALRHETIFNAYRGLPAGTAFVLVNDHDPKPLRYQFEAEHAGQFTWSYLEAGPSVWRVRIGRAGA